MKYLFLLQTAGDAPELGTPEAAEAAAAYGAVLADMRQAGVLIDCAPLHPAAMATTVRVRGGETLLSDGPAAELKEQVGGYTIVDCPDLDDALKWAARIPVAAVGSVEVRAAVDLNPPD